MKRFAILLLFVTSLLPAQDIIDTNSVVIAWDAVTMLTDGTVIPPEDTLEYEIVMAPRGDRTSLTILGRTPDLFYTVTFVNEGMYEVGVRAIRTTTSVETESVLTWSEDSGFVIRHLLAPEPPGGLRVP
jgi:hypothetical protein